MSSMLPLLPAANAGGGNVVISMATVSSTVNIRLPALQRCRFFLSIIISLLSEIHK